MEKYSFLKFLKNKRKILTNQIGGGVEINIKEIQKKLLFIKLRLDSFKVNDTTFDPYDKLKNVIDSINKKIDSMKHNNDMEIFDKSELINKINDMEIALNIDPTDYNEIKVSNKLNFVGEKINTEQMSSIMNVYINDSKKYIEECKEKIGGNGDSSLLDNEMLGALYDDIQKQINEFKQKIEPFNGFKLELEKHIQEMEKLFDFKINDIHPIKQDSNMEIVSKIDKINDMEEESKSDFEEIKIIDESEIDKLIGTEFINSKQSGGADIKETNSYIKQLYDEWYKQVKSYKDFLIEKQNRLNKIESYKNIIEKNRKKFDKIKNIFSELKEDNINTNEIIILMNTKAEYYEKKYIEQKNSSILIDFDDMDINIGNDEFKTIKNILLSKKIELENKIKESVVCENLLREELRNNGYTSIANKIKKEMIDELKKEQSNPRYINNKIKKKLVDSYIKCIVDTESLKNIIETIDSIIDGNNKYLFLQKGGAPKTLLQVIDKLSEYSNLVINMKKIKNILIKTVKKYNIRYVQYYNFQKYIVNYVSLKLAVGGYMQYNYISKGHISFYQSLLDKLDKILNKFDNYKENFDDNDVKSDTNKWFYGKHYFIIKILKKFFDGMYTIWDKDVNFVVDVNDNNNIYFFLFKIFVDILDKYHMQLPAVANYLRINDISGKNKFDAFKKRTKNNLDITELKKCESFKNDADIVSKIHFEEVFDPENFNTNDVLSQYMGLSQFLLKGKSIMLLTYGYSGVGKTYTLFGTKETKGMLQNTLDLLGTVEKSVKIFELYGLAVPYKFYWDDHTKFSHCIYNYKIDGTYNKIDDMGSFLDLNNNYENISPENIMNFSNIVGTIDEERKKNGRIKATINNPESSRSIMIYDFKINRDGKTSHFVIMDLPGKENLFETYCNNNVDKNYGINFDNNVYDEQTIRSMMYINPLWLSMIPSIAQNFDTMNKGNHTNIDNINNNIPIYGLFKPSGDDENNLLKTNLEGNQTRLFKQLSRSNAHEQYHLFLNDEDSKKSKQEQKQKLDKTMKNTLGLRGLQQRAMFTMVNLIKEGKLEDMGIMLNNLIKDGDKRDKRYGFAGLEGVYINENILGLLQVLSNIIRNKRNQKEINIVCSQNELYKKELKEKYLLETKLKSQSETFVNDNDFYSQIVYMNKYRDETFDNKNNDKFKNKSSSQLKIINNYNYDKIYNINDPPIKKILAPYFNVINNYYLFFVVSNNLKDGNINTCDKQMKLLYDTQKFMQVIADIDKQIEPVKCVN